MNWRFIFMLLGTLACLAPLYLAPTYILRLPALLEVQFSSWSAFVSWAFVLVTSLTPVVCIISILRGWYAWLAGPRERALTRLLLWPIVAVAVAAALLMLTRFAGAN